MAPSTTNSTSSDSFSIGYLRSKLKWNFYQNAKFSFQENAFQNVVGKVIAPVQVKKPEGYG